MIHESGISQSVKDRFWSKVRTAGVNECWEWTASKAHGYGQFGVVWMSRPIGAHRLSYLINVGEIPDGMLVCHKCDNRGCVNPAHLFLGNKSDNALDASRKGRLHTHVKLSEHDIALIRSMWVPHKRNRWPSRTALTQEEIAKMFGTTRRYIGEIVRREVRA